MAGKKPPRLMPPIRGVSNSSTFIDTPGDVVPLDGVGNCRPFTPTDDRPRFGTRPGLEALNDTPLGTASSRQIRGMGSISRASAITSFRLGASTPLTFGSANLRTAGMLTSNLNLFSTVARCLRESYLVDGDSGQGEILRHGDVAVQTVPDLTGFPSSIDPTWCAVHPSKTLLAAGFNYTVSGQARVAVFFIEPVRGLVIGCKIIAPTTDTPENNTDSPSACWTDNALWIPRGRQMWYVPTPVQAARARLHDPTNTSTLLSATDTAHPLTYVGKIVSVASVFINARWYIWGAFEGTTDAGTYANPIGAITSGGYAKHYRSGLVLWTEGADVGENTYALTVRVPDEVLSLSDSYVEVDTSGAAVTEYTTRFSTWLNRAPRGALPAAVAADPSDGSAVVIFTNQGYGPNSGFPPDGSVAYSTVAKFNIAGTLLWEVDTQSSIANEDGGKLAGVGTTYPSDIPDEDGGNAGTTSKDGPAARSVVVDQAGRVFVAGRVSSGRANVFCLGGAGGNQLWRARTESNNPTSGSPAWIAPGLAGAGTPKNGLGIDPSDGRLLALGRRCVTWQSVDSPPTGNAGLLFKMVPADGSIEWALSPLQDYQTGPLYDDPTPLCIAVADGSVLIGTTTYADS